MIPIDSKRGAAGQQYAIVIGLIAVIGISAISFLGGSVRQLFTRTSNTLGGVTNAASAPVVSGPVTYSFTTHTFTPCGATGINGPLQSACVSAYSAASWASNTSNFTVTGGIQSWTVPETGNYLIEAAGAEGGDGTDSTDTIAGKGAVISGVFALTQGSTIKILVGQKGGDANVSCTGGNRGAGGGGGSYVVSGATPLLIAGGGNGDSWGSWNTNAPGGQTGNNGDIGGLTTQQSSTLYGRGGGGGGFTNNGSNSAAGELAYGGASFLNGGTGGGTTQCFSGVGGFGGGGGSFYEGGGGGGYSGGHVVHTNDYNANFPSYGGGSYNSGTSPAAVANSRSGAGYVTITKQ